MKERQRHISLALILFMGILFTQAQDAQELTEAVQVLLQLSGFVDANVQFCNEQASETSVSVQKAATTWRTNSRLELLDTVRDFSTEGKQVFAEMESIFFQENLQDLKSRASSRALEWWSAFPSTFAAT